MRYFPKHINLFKFGDMLRKFFIIALVIFALPGCAKADEYRSFFQFTCAPSIQYFAAQTFTLDDVVFSSQLNLDTLPDTKNQPSKFPKKAHRIKQPADWEKLASNGIYYFEQPPKHPLICNILGHTISAEVIVEGSESTLGQRARHHVKPIENSCAEVGDKKVRIDVDGRWSDNLYSHCRNGFIHDTIYIYQSAVRHCTEHSGEYWSPGPDPDDLKTFPQQWHAASEECKQTLLEPNGFLSDDPVVLRAEAEQGYALAQSKLGDLYWSGNKDLMQDYAEALKWHRMAADQGVADAQYALGAQYADGNGVPKDYVEAAYWYHKAAEQGNEWAQEYLGQLYQFGRGVKQNNVEAYFWYGVAMKAAGELPITRDRDEIAKSLTPRQKATVDMRVKKWKPTPATAKADKK